tara:strand:+ start:3311 stop:4123 length:813 start_codon:yes stop_codon:yes gene_type:complete
MRAAVALLTIWLVLLSGPAVSFGADGHRIVVMIAENHLSTKTAGAINQITDHQSLGDLALWPDRIRYLPAWEHSKYWHYLSIDDHEQFGEFTRHPDGDVLSALDYFFTELQDPKLTKQQQLEALSFFIHFVADIHQPLHVGRRDDRGGNKIKIKWLTTSKATNLHRVWDSQIIDAQNNSPEQYSQMLDKASTAQLAQWQDSTFLDWARESKTLRSLAYNFGAVSKRMPIPIGPAYIGRNNAIIERRLLMAGVRLADCLNRIFDPASNRRL